MKIVPKRCAECGKPIPKARLEALPCTTTCVDCSSEACLRVYDIDLEAADTGDLVKIVHGE